MELRLLRTGSMFNVYAIVLDNGACPAADFLAQLERNMPLSLKSFTQLLTRHTYHGAVKNERKSRVIKGKENLLEFKTRQGDRLVYFYLPGRKTVLTHGFHKGADVSLEYNRAERIRDQYLREIENDE